MATGINFKDLYGRYQREGVPHQLSIVCFCQMNSVVYGYFGSEKSDSCSMVVNAVLKNKGSGGK